MARTSKAVQQTESRLNKTSMRTRIGLVLLGALLVVPAVFVNTAIGYVPLLSYLILLGLCWGYVRILENRISFVSAHANNECIRGESAQFSLALKNDSWLPAVRVQTRFFLSDIFGGEGSSDVRTITLGPRSEKTFDFSVRFDHIGNYQVGVREVSVCDPIGVFASTRLVDKLNEVSVQPRIFDLDSLELARDANIEARRNFTAVINEGMDYSGVRDYHWGDPIKAIHWKLSSRLDGDKYLTRLYETNANPGLAIVADFDAPEYPVEGLMSIYDAVVESAFSLIRYAEKNDFNAELLFRDKFKQAQSYRTPVSGKRQEILDRMPQIFSPGTGVEALSLVEEELKSVYAQTNLIVCTSVISKSLVETLISARSGKRTPVLLAIIPKIADDERRKEYRKLLSRLDSEGIYYTIISSASKLPGAAEVHQRKGA